MTPMTPNEYQKNALRTEKTPEFLRNSFGERRGRARLVHAAFGLCTEAGEIQDAIKRELIYGKPIDKTNIVEECGDLLWYIAIALDSVDATMEDAMTKNIAKLRARFPDGFTEEAALVRDLDAERAALENEEGDSGEEEIGSDSEEADRLIAGLQILRSYGMRSVEFEDSRVASDYGPDPTDTEDTHTRRLLELGWFENAVGGWAFQG